jgi:hypothetical protein
MSDLVVKDCVARCDHQGLITISMQGKEYNLSLIEGRALLQSIQFALNAAQLVCDDCGNSNSTVERSGCPVTNKPATLCEFCFFRRDSQQ